MQKLIILTSFSLLLGACSWMPEVYTVPRYQGNVVEQKMVNQLVPGLSREQVVFIMGTPLVQDSFHQNRWDYVYTTQTVSDDRTQEHISLFFNENDALASLQGDFKPEPEAEVSDEMVEPLPERPAKVAARTQRNAQPTKTPTTNEKPFQGPGEDTTIYTGGTINAIPPEEVTETQATPAADPYSGLTPDGKLATPTPAGSVDSSALTAPKATPTPSPTIVPVTIN